MQDIKLIIISLDVGFNHQRQLLKSVNEAQKEKALRYKNEKDQMRSLLSSYLKNVLSKEEILYKEKGKPYFENGPYFNVSHSGKYVVMAISDKEVGVDIEENVQKDMSSIIRIFNDAEAKVIKEHSDFYYLWCAKESLIKCMGSSIAKIKEIPSLPLNGLKTFKGVDYQVQTFIYDKHIISVTREGNESFIVKTTLLTKLPTKI